MAETWEIKVEMRARAFLERFKDLPFPLDLVEIAKRLGYRVVEYSPKDTAVKGGFSESADPEPIIYLDSTAPDAVKRATIAREIYELLYHRDPLYQRLRESGLVAESSSREPEVFAGLVLLPDGELDSMLKRGLPAKRIAQEAAVPEQMAEGRIAQMKGM